MASYTNQEIVLLSHRVQYCFYAHHRMRLFLNQLKDIPENQRGFNTTLALPSMFYIDHFNSNLSELFRFFYIKDDQELLSKLKSTPEQRLEFRKKLRQAAVHSMNSRESTELLTSFWKKNKEVQWVQEFYIILEYVKDVHFKVNESEGIRFKEEIISISQTNI